MSVGQKMVGHSRRQLLPTHISNLGSNVFR
jgi:hypothetical protein